MKEERITQERCVLNWWKEHKYISSIESFSCLYIVDLQGVIRNLKEKGFNIADKWVYTHNIYGKPVRYKRYWLEEINMKGLL